MKTKIEDIIKHYPVENQQEVKNILAKLKMIYEKEINYDFMFLNKFEENLVIDFSQKFNLYVHIDGKTSKCERKYFSVFQKDNQLDYEKTIIYQLKYSPKFQCLSHSQIMGSIYNTIDDHKLIGDINVDDDGNAEVYLSKKVQSYFEISINRIDKVPVSWKEIDLPTIGKRELIICERLLKNNRLDSFLKSVLNYSRSKTQNYILKKNILINSLIVTKVDKKILAGDIVEISKFGKIIIDEIIILNDQRIKIMFQTTFIKGKNK